MISIIIPVYNSAIYLPECLDSILNQTYQHYEIILIDDGSTDCSWDICCFYAQKYSNIKIIHQQNGGSTKARKTGLRAAKGKYVLFVDSDDWIDSCCLQKLYELAELNHSDIVVSGCVNQEFNRLYKQFNKFDEGYYSGKRLKEVIYPQMLYFNKNGFFCFGILQYVWGKLFKKSIIEQCMYNLDERIYDGEDVACVYDACLRASSIVIDNHSYYHYRIHENSICTSVRDEKYFANAVYLYNYMAEVFRKSEESEIMLPQLKHFIGTFVNNGMISAFECGYQKSYTAAIWKLPDIPSDKKYRFALFGAGNMGLSYYKQLLDYTNIEIVVWVDSNVHDKKIGGISIQSPEALKETEWDYVLIAVRKSLDREEILKSLSKMGIVEQKILYREAERYSELYEFCLLDTFDK